MLTSLSIRNVVLISSLDLSFESGLGVLTGQTGAGKSILLDSLSFVLGARADTGLIRHGEKMMSVSASFSSIDKSVIDFLAEQDIQLDDDELILRRSLTQEGKSKAFLNDQPVSVSLLKALGTFLVEINGQFATQGLLDLSTHLSFLDAFGVDEKKLKDLKSSFDTYQAIHQKKQTLQEELQKTLDQKELLEQYIFDLEKLNPQIGEEETLIQKRTLLMNSEKIIENINQVYQLLNSENAGVLDRLSQIRRPLEQANRYANNAFDSLVDNFSQAHDLLIDVSCQLESTTQEWGDTSELAEIDERLFKLKDMARRHKVSIDELPAFLDTLKGHLSQLTQSDELIQELTHQEKQALEAYLKQSQEIHQLRVEAGLLLDQKVQQELPDLKLDKALFKTQVVLTDSLSSTGQDAVTFTVSTNKGPFAPINKIASGGELSRFMLALKINLAEKSVMPTLIFDEVDSGIGGETADAVGSRLNILAQSCQVLVVTHSPQVASYADQHWCVSKQEKDEKIITHVALLDEAQKIEEIARMLSGAQITSLSQKMAQELIQKARHK